MMGYKNDTTTRWQSYRFSAGCGCFLTQFRKSFGTHSEQQLGPYQHGGNKGRNMMKKRRAIFGNGVYVDDVALKFFGCTVVKQSTREGKQQHSTSFFFSRKNPSISRNNRALSRYLVLSEKTDEKPLLFVQRLYLLGETWYDLPLKQGCSSRHCPLRFVFFLGWR